MRLAERVFALPGLSPSRPAMWNALSGMLAGGQLALILVVISRVAGSEQAAVFTIGSAIALLASFAGRYGLRNYQVTDPSAHVHFKDYLWWRLLTVGATLLLVTGILFLLYRSGSYSSEKAIVVWLLCVYKLTDSVEDVFTGLYQQRGRLDVGAKIFLFRLLVSTATICVNLVLTGNLLTSVALGALVSIFLSILLLKVTFPFFGISLEFQNSQIVKRLAVDGWPLCVAATLLIYVGNMPKYLIDAFATETVQAVFGFLNMPVFLILLISGFLYQPMIKQMGEWWNSGALRQFWSRISKQIFNILALTGLAVFVGYLVGIPMLSVLFSVDLSHYRRELLILLVGGGIYALIGFFVVIITIMRQQRTIAYGYIGAAVLGLIFGRYFVGNYQVLGAGLLYLLVNAALAITFYLAIVANVRRVSVPQ